MTMAFGGTMPVDYDYDSFWDYGCFFGTMTVDYCLSFFIVWEQEVYKPVFNFVCIFEKRRSDIVAELAGCPTDNAFNGAVFKQLYRFILQDFLHLKSSNLLFSPRAVTVATNSFMVAANLAPSAADTHSTLVLPLSIPR